MVFKPYQITLWNFNINVSHFLEYFTFKEIFYHSKVFSLKNIKNYGSIYFEIIREVLLHLNNLFRRETYKQNHKKLNDYIPLFS